MLSRKIWMVSIALLALILAAGSVAAEQTDSGDILDSTDELDVLTTIDGESNISENSTLLGENCLEKSESESVGFHEPDSSLKLDENRTETGENSKLNTYIDIFDMGSQYDVSVYDENDEIVGNAKIYVNGVLQHSVGGTAFIDNPFFNSYAYGYRTFNIKYNGDGTHYASSRIFTISLLTIDVGPQKVTLTKSQYDYLKKHKAVRIWLKTYKTHKVITSYRNVKVTVKKYTKSTLLGTYKIPVADLYKSSTKTKVYRYGKYLGNKAKKIAKKKHLKVDGNTFKYTYKISNGKAIYKCYIKYYKYVNKIKKVPVYTKKKFRQYVTFWYDKKDSTYNYGVADNYVKQCDYVYSIKLY